MSEGCLSCPEINVEVSRFTEIKVRAYDIHGGKITDGIPVLSPA
jgi:N-formylmethionyl-tRNA deformylase